MFMIILMIICFLFTTSFFIALQTSHEIAFQKKEEELKRIEERILGKKR